MGGVRERERRDRRPTRGRSGASMMTTTTHLLLLFLLLRDDHIRGVAQGWEEGLVLHVWGRPRPEVRAAVEGPRGRNVRLWPGVLLLLGLLLLALLLLLLLNLGRPRVLSPRHGCRGPVSHSVVSRSPSIDRSSALFLFSSYVCSVSVRSSPRSRWSFLAKPRVLSRSQPPGARAIAGNGLARF